MKIIGFVYSLRDILQETPVARAMGLIILDKESLLTFFKQKAIAKLHNKLLQMVDKGHLQFV